MCVANGCPSDELSKVKQDIDSSSGYWARFAGCHLVVGFPKNELKKPLRAFLLMSLEKCFPEAKYIEKM